MTQLADQITAGDRGVPVRVLESITLAEGFTLGGATIELYGYVGTIDAPLWKMTKHLGPDLILDEESGALVWIPTEDDWTNFPAEPGPLRLSLYVEVTLSTGQRQSVGSIFLTVLPDENRSSA